MFCTGREGPALHLGSAVGLVQVAGVLVSKPVGVSVGDLALPLICCEMAWRGRRSNVPFLSLTSCRRADPESTSIPNYI